MKEGHLGVSALFAHHGQYDVVPADVAEKVRARDASCVVRRDVSEPETTEDDSYADYRVPDDLRW